MQHDHETPESEGRCSTSDSTFKSYISVTPCSLPHGLITTHQISSLEDEDEGGDQPSMRTVPFSGMNMVEIHRCMGEVIVDHCWTRSSSKYCKSGQLLVLAILTRKRGLNIPSSSDDAADAAADADKQNDGNNASTLHIQWRDDYHAEMGETRRRGSIDEAFTNRMAISLPFIASSIATNRQLLVIGSSTGAIVHRFEDLMTDHPQGAMKIRHDLLKSLKLMNTFVVHTMDISNSYFAAVSGERIGVWDTKNIIEAIESDAMICTAAWSSKLDGQHRATCIRISTALGIDEDGQYMALSSWDGSAVVFRNIGADGWERVGKLRVAVEEEQARSEDNDDSIPPPWEQSSINSDQRLSPSFVEIIESGVGGEAIVVLAVSTSASPAVRFYNVENACLSTTMTASNASEGEFTYIEIQTLAYLVLLLEWL